MCDLATTPPATFRQLLSCHTRSSLRHAVRSERLRRPFHGVYVGAELPRSTAVDARAAQLSIGRDLPAAFHTGAALRGFGVLDDGATHLVGAEHFDHRPQAGLFVHSGAVVPDVSMVRGVRCVSAARAAVDLARTSTAADALAVLDACLATGVCAPADLLAEVERHRGLRGVVQARTAIEFADGRAESPQESRLRWIAIAAGLPTPDLQVPVSTPDGTMRLDMAWREAKIGIEYDGHGHADVGLLRYDRMRHNALVLLGWQVLTFTDWDVLDHPQRTAARLAAALGWVPRIVPTPIRTPRAA